MSKSARQKLKLLYLKDILSRRSDEEHPLNAKELIKELSDFGIEAERKSIYNDIEALSDYGLDVLKAEEGKSGYFVASRDFELAELKLLVDAVQSSHFITAKKSDQLIKKLSGLANIYDEDRLNRQVYSVNRVKSQNEGILITVDAIHEAIQADRAVSFQYMAWSTDKKLVPKHDGRLYRVSPLVLIWDDEYYYLLGLDMDDKRRKTFRVDKIRGIERLSLSRETEEEPINIAEYTNKVFGMFSGEASPVSIRVPDEKIGIFIDRFGTGISVFRFDDKNVRVHTEVEVSAQFFGWLLSLGSDVELLGPDKVRKEYADFLKDNLNNYLAPY